MNKLQELAITLFNKLIDDKNKSILRQLYGTSGIDKELIEYIIYQLERTNFWLDIKWNSLDNKIYLDRDNYIHLKDEYLPRLLYSAYTNSFVEYPYNAIKVNNKIYITDRGKGIIQVNPDNFEIENIVVNATADGNQITTPNIYANGYNVIKYFENANTKFFIVGVRLSNQALLKFYDENFNYLFGTSINGTNLFDIEVVDENNIFISFQYGGNGNYGVIKAGKIDSFDANGYPTSFSLYDFGGTDIMLEHTSGTDVLSPDYIYRPRTLKYYPEENKIYMTSLYKIHIYEVEPGNGIATPSWNADGIITPPRELTKVLRTWSTIGFDKDNEYYYVGIMNGDIVTGIAKIKIADNSLVSIIGKQRTYNVTVYETGEDTIINWYGEMGINPKPIYFSYINSILLLDNGIMIVDSTNRFVSYIPKALFDIGSIVFESEDYLETYKFAIKDYYVDAGEIYIKIGEDDYKIIKEMQEVPANVTFKFKRVINPTDLLESPARLNVRLLVE